MSGVGKRGLRVMKKFWPGAQSIVELIHLVRNRGSGGGIIGAFFRVVDETPGLLRSWHML